MLLQVEELEDAGSRMSKQFYSKKSEKLAAKALSAYREGRHRVDIHEARLLEDRVRRDQWDVVRRCKLLGFYRHEKSQNAPKRWCNHAEWLIKSCPDERFIPFVLHIPQDVSEEQLDALKKCFMQKVKRNPKNANVAGHAAMFFNQSDAVTAQKLFKKAMKLAPDHELWHRESVNLHVKKAHNSKEEKHILDAYKTGLKFVKKFNKVPQKRGPIALVLGTLFDLALESNDFKMAHLLLKKIKHSELDKVFPHRKHECAGLLAIKEGDLETAKKQLLKVAKKQQGSPRLKLAEQLFNAGETDCVCEYLEFCISKMDSQHQQKDVDQFKRWIDQLRTGKKVKLSIEK